MTILGIDCASSGCSVCVHDGATVRALLIERMARGQDARLIPMVQEAMAQAGLSYAALERIACVCGPGSFTGIRIGLAAARGLAFAANKPALGIDRFSIYRALHAQESRPLLVVLESRRRELFMFDYGLESVFDPARAEMRTPDEIASFLSAHPDCVVAGDARESLSSCVDPARLVAATETEVERCAVLASLADPSAPAFLPRPFYLRAPDVTFPKEEVCA